jgi:N-acetylglutamate synthase-like GNAT family acetyltransferase
LKNIKTIIASQLDENQVGFLVGMINQVYLQSEEGMWKEEHQRITSSRLIEIIDKRELLLAMKQNVIYGCIHLELMDEFQFKFKMLVANPEFKREGIGAVLVNFAEKEARKKGATIMQLELLVPTDFKILDKAFLKSWYMRIGYKKIAEHDVNYVDEGLSKLLKTDCIAMVYQKVL